MSEGEIETLSCRELLGKFRKQQVRGEYFSSKFIFCTYPKNGPAQESGYAFTQAAKMLAINVQY